MQTKSLSVCLSVFGAAIKTYFTLDHNGAFYTESVLKEIFVAHLLFLKFMLYFTAYAFNLRGTSDITPCSPLNQFHFIGIYIFFMFILFYTDLYRSILIFKYEL